MRRGLALVAFIAACDHDATITRPSATAAQSASSAPTASAPPPSASADRCAMDAAKLADIRAKVKTLKPGMSSTDVDRVLGLDWKCFGGSGQGNPNSFTSGSVLAPGVQLNLAWERKGEAELVLRAAAVTP